MTESSRRRSILGLPLVWPPTGAAAPALGGRAPRRSPGRRGLWQIGWAVLAAVILAGCSQGSGSPSATPTTSAAQNIFKATGVRTGQIYVPPGRTATKGPIGSEPVPRSRLPLNILSGLAHDQPIYDGDFADPSALDVSNTLYFYASSSSPSKNDHGANMPVIATDRGLRFLWSLPRRCVAQSPVVVGVRIPMGPGRLGPAGQHLRHVLLHSGHRPAGMSRHAARARAASRLPRADERRVHLPSHRDEPDRPFRRQLELGVHLPGSMRVEQSTRACSSLRTGRPGCCGRATATAATSRRPSTRSSCRADGLSTVGPPHRLIGATQPWEDNLVEAPSMIQDHGPLLALLFGQPLGTQDLRHRYRPAAPRSSGRAPSHSTTPGSPPTPTG